MKIKILTTLICFLCFGLLNGNAQEETPKEQKKIIIVKKIIDENGNETVEKTVKTGIEADKYMEEVNIKGNGEKVEMGKKC